MKSFWPLANFGILQRAPETSQGEILNKLGSCGVLNYMESIVWWVVNLKFYYSVSIINIDILEIILSF